ncbi:hypothetical protein ACEE90_04235 [Corynebacterium phoceense]
MRIRNAAIAGATALAVAFGGTTVATAAETSSDQNTSSNANGSSASNGADVDENGNLINESDKEEGGTLSSKIGASLDAKEKANGRAIFGSSKSENDGADTLDDQPAWAKALYGTTIATAIATVIGLIVGPLANFVQFGPFSR